MESEADRIGLQLAAQACYTPGSAVQVFQKFNLMEKKSGVDNVPGFLRTHPMNDARIAAIQKNLPAATELYEASGCRQKQSAFRCVSQRELSAEAVHSSPLNTSLHSHTDHEAASAMTDGPEGFTFCGRDL